jgi:phage terminase large subunit-like protein
VHVARKNTAPTRADLALEFIGNLIVPHGHGAGDRIHLEQFEIDWIRDVYVETNGRRKCKRAILSIARKNGKSLLMACIALVHLVGPEAILNGEIISAANDREQAAVVFNLAAKMVRSDPELHALINVIDSTKRMVCLHTGSVYKAISAEAGTKHGLNPSVWIFDELAQAKNRELFDVLDTSQGARSEPLGVVISTQSNDPQHILSQMIDDGLSGADPTIVCHLYAVDDDVENIFDESIWRDANPGLGTIRSLEEMQMAAFRASRLPSFENTFRNLYLNQRVTRQAVLAPKGIWKACEDPELAFVDGEPVILSLDLAGVVDLAALGMISVENGARFRAWFWKPEDLLEDHGKRDRVQYDLYNREGYLEVSPGRTINPQAIALKIGELMRRYDVRGLVYDRWRIETLKRELELADLSFQEGPDGDGLPLYPWGQGFVSMAPALEALEQLLMEGELRHPGNPILTQHFANAVVSTDPAGNRKFDKEKSRMRIDGAQALAMAAGKRAQMNGQKPPESYLESGEMLFG